jgi:Electron transfer DM13
MKFNALIIALLSVTAIAGFTSCEKEVEVLVDTTKPQGTFTASKSGSFVEQNATGSKGVAQLGTDAEGTQFLKFGSDFSSSFATGTVTVYLSTSMTFTPDPANGNPALRLIGPVSKAGENYFRLDPVADAKFTHVILWCGSANVPFGYAPLQ